MHLNPGETEQTLQRKPAFQFQSGYLVSESAVHLATLRDVNNFSFFSLSSTPQRPHYISTVSRALSQLKPESAELDAGARQHSKLVNFTYFYCLSILAPVYIFATCITR
jgi:hypothetical protein